MIDLGLHFNLHPNNFPERGPQKVVQNLIKGLRRIGVEPKINEVRKYNGCLQWIPNIMDLPEDTLMGPNLMVMPNDHPEVWSKFKRYVHPSQWTIDIYKSFDICKGVQIQPWAVGIDTDFWAPSSDIKRDCFIVYKKPGNGRKKVLNEQIIQVLAKHRLWGEYFLYGEYEELSLWKACKRAKVAIVITGTESQGIALMQILSMGVPCYVVDAEEWSGYKATSAPYFNSDILALQGTAIANPQRYSYCGAIEPEFNPETLEKVINHGNVVNPRQYILDNFTLEKAAQRYLEILLCG